MTNLQLHAAELLAGGNAERWSGKLPRSQLLVVLIDSERELVRVRVQFERDIITRVLRAQHLVRAALPVMTSHAGSCETATPTGSTCMMALQLRQALLELAVQMPDFFFGSDLVADIGAGAEPARDAALRIAERHSARDEPLVLSVLARAVERCLPKTRRRSMPAGGAPWCARHDQDAARRVQPQRSICPRRRRCSRTSAGCTRRWSHGVGHPGKLRDGVGKRPELLFALPQLLGAFLDPLFEFAIEPFKLPRLAMEFGEDADLGPQELRDDGDGDVVHRAALVALDAVQIGEVDGGDEDDGGLLEARMLAHHLRQLEAIDLRHADVHQHDGDIVA